MKTLKDMVNRHIDKKRMRHLFSEAAKMWSFMKIHNGVACAVDFPRFDDLSNCSCASRKTIILADHYLEISLLASATILLAFSMLSASGFRRHNDQDCVGIDLV